MIRDLTSANTGSGGVEDDAQNTAAQSTDTSLPPADAPSAEPKVSRRLAKVRPAQTSRADTATASLKADRSNDVGRRSRSSKADIVLKKLGLARGITVAQIMEATGWQAHSVRGFLSAVVRKRLGLDLVSEVGKDGQRRYRIVGSEGSDAGKAG